MKLSVCQVWIFWFYFLKKQLRKTERTVKCSPSIYPFLVNNKVATVKLILCPTQISKWKTLPHANTVCPSYFVWGPGHPTGRRCYVSNCVSSARTSGVSCLAALAASAMARRYGPFLFLSNRNWKLSRNGASWASGRKEVVGEPNHETRASWRTASPVSPRRDTVMPSTRAGHHGKP